MENQLNNQQIAEQVKFEGRITKDILTGPGVELTEPLEDVELDMVPGDKVDIEFGGKEDKYRIYIGTNFETSEKTLRVVDKEGSPVASVGMGETLDITRQEFGGSLKMSRKHGSLTLNPEKGVMLSQIGSNGTRLHSRPGLMVQGAERREALKDDLLKGSESKEDTTNEDLSLDTEVNNTEVNKYDEAFLVTPRQVGGVAVGGEIQKDPIGLEGIPKRSIELFKPIVKIDVTEKDVPPYLMPSEQSPFITMESSIKRVDRQKNERFYSNYDQSEESRKRAIFGASEFSELLRTNPELRTELERRLGPRGSELVDEHAIDLIDTLSDDREVRVTIGNFLLDKVRQYNLAPRGEKDKSTTEFGGYEFSTVRSSEWVALLALSQLDGTFNPDREINNVGEHRGAVRRLFNILRREDPNRRAPVSY